MTASGERHRRASYRTSAGIRYLVAQRIAGRVALVDEPADHDGPVLLIERHVTSLAELDICDAYVAHRETVDRPAVLAQRDVLDELCGMVA